MRKIKRTVSVIAMLLIVSCLVLSPSQGQESQEKVIKNLTLVNADIRSVLSYLADYGGVNIVPGPSVRDTVSLRLRDVTWRQALDIVLNTHGLSGVESDGFIKVVPTSRYMATKNAEEKYLYEQRAIARMQTRIIPISYATARDLVKPVKAVLSDRGVIDTDDRTNSIIIKDIPENLQKAEEMIGALDKETAQIRISAQLLEVESAYLSELGINWSAISRKTVDHPSLTPGDSSTYTPEYEVAQQAADLVSDPIGIFKYSTIESDFNIDAAISAIVSSSKGRIIGHPEITTVDNMEANIQMGQDIPIKQFDESGNVVITFYKVGTKLRVTPHITSESRILMHLLPERSSYQFDANGIIINTQNAETHVVVSNGQTAVIGGLTTQEIKNYNSGIPLLKDIPIVGHAFRYTKKEVTSRDLLIFVTPTIVEQQPQ
jgi:type IV pilus secretin PilQ/predicted competence protein